MRILLVEDDLMLGESLQDILMQYDYLVDWHKDGERVLHTLQTQVYDLVILDVGLPIRSGLEVLQELRVEGMLIPVMLLTARDNVAERVQGLDAGADDYVLKPFDLDELLARIRSLLRRHTGRAQNALLYGDIKLEPISQQVWQQESLVELSRHEYRLLKALLEHVGLVLTRDQLEQALYGDDGLIESNSLEVHIHHLRKKLSASFIKTLRGIGYMVPKLD